MKAKRGIDSLVAFLGVPGSGYSRTIYEWEGREYETRYSPEAIAYFFRPKRLLVMVTPTARAASTTHKEGEEAKNNLEDLTERTAVFGCQTVPVDILETVGEASSWELFTTCFNAIRPDERVIFDFTYGFRFIPMLVVLAGQFLNVTKGVETAGIYYGAYEGRDSLGRTPIIDLSDYSRLMVWTQAAAHFNETGNAAPLLKAMDDVRSPFLVGIREQLRATSQGLRLGIAPQVGRSVSELVQWLHVAPIPPNLPAAAPLQALYGTIAAKYANLALEEGLRPDDTPLDQKNAPAHLRQQAHLLLWYIKHDQALQACLLAREWVVTWVAMDMDVHGLLRTDELNTAPDMLLLPRVREKAEELLNAYIRGNHRKSSSEERERSMFAEQQLQTVRGWKEIVQLWSDCTRVRNQVAHMSMRPNPRTIPDIRKRLHAIKEEIEQLVAMLPVSWFAADDFGFTDEK